MADTMADRMTTREAIEELEYMSTGYAWEHGEGRTLQEIARVIERLDGIRAGRWEERYAVGTRKRHVVAWACSECGYVGEKSPYCPACGTGMEVAEDDD